MIGFNIDLLIFVLSAVLVIYRLIVVEIFLVILDI